jgi:hypothetical protein
MLKLLPLAPSLTLLGILVAAPALADPSWDHRSMQSHHQATDRAEPQLAPGEKRVGRILIGTASATSRSSVPETLETATQRQWIQRGSFTDGTRAPTFNAPRVRAGRYDGTPGASHSSPSR